MPVNIATGNSSITINGRRIDLPPGARGVVSVKNDRVYVDGVEVAQGLSGVVEVRWEGPLANLRADGSVTVVSGDVRGDVDAGGSVEIRGGVGGDVGAGGSVSCGDVYGDVDAGGSVECGEVEGDVDAGGDVHHH